MRFRYLQPSGCLLLLLGVCTLGVANLILYLKARRWPAFGDDQGLVLRDGTRILWSSFSGAKEVVTDVNGTVVRRLDLWSSQGTVSFPFERVHDAQQAVDYLLAHMPAQGATDAPAPEANPQPASPVRSIPAPSPGPPGTQTFFCPACGYTWGPVGVRPFVPGAAEQQHFLVCRGCGELQTQVTAEAPAALACTRCGAAQLAPLVSCPRCGGGSPRWV